jgi:acetylglutamate kinase|tara:strand:- start:2175 stop:2981 length:807 start_codon:yes stop_codon:yes gene_type:complete
VTASNKRDISGKTIVIKIGGSTLGEGDSTVPDIVDLWTQGARPVVVHGGGKVISDWVAKQGIQPEFIRGLRRTDEATLDVAVAVLGGLVNSQLVAEFQAAGASAVGISGVSGGLLQAEVLDPDLGFVGKIVKANATPVEAVLNSGSIPVIAPTALHLYPSESGEDRILNVNADTSAGHIAKAVRADQLVFQTNVEGVLDARRRLIPRMTRGQAVDLIAGGIAVGGMIPKIEACADAVTVVGSGHIIDGRVAGALLVCARGEDIGTKII